MIRNYLKVALRNIKKNKLYAGLNILGLSVGLASFFIIYLFIQNELAYDQFHEKKDRIYRIIDEDSTGELVTVKNGGMTSAFAPLVASGIPEVEAFSRVLFKRLRLRVGEEEPTELSQGIAVDKGFLEIFTLDFVRGDADSMLDAPVSILLNKSKALEYFGDYDVLGETISDGGNEYLISGVYADLPNTSSLKGDFILLTKDETAFRGHGSWGVNLYAQSYFLLKNGSQTNEVEKKINKVYTDNRGSMNGHNFSLEALSDVHFSLDVSGPVMQKTDRQYVLIFSLVAIFILSCAVFNYISLALSQSLERAKEIGVRKVIGAKRTSLYSQFITESVIQIIMSFVAAILLVELLIPQLELLVERDLGIRVFQAPEIIAKGFLFSLLIALVSAVYPAYLSTRMKVVNIFKRKSGSGSSNRMIAFVAVFQIIVFIALTCTAVTSNRQMHFMRNENLGFDQDLQYVINGLSYRSEKAFKNDVLGITGVESASLARVVPTKWAGTTSFKGVKGRFQTFDIDEDYLETMGMTLLEGRNFKQEDIIDSATVIMVNATAAKEIAPDGSAVGKVLPFGRDGGMYSKGGDKRIIGVVSDFHYVSKKEIIEPALFHPIQYPSLLVVKLSDINLSRTIEQIGGVYKEHNAREINAYFLDDEVEAQYKQENVMITMINTFMAVAAIVAFIGLFGIAGYSVKRRTKEVGIKKVLGARFMAIQSTLNRASLGKLILAIVISIPLVVYWMDNWLNDFAYRIEIPYLLIFSSVLAAAIVLLLVASFHSIKVFLLNPIEVLKDE